MWTGFTVGIALTLFVLGIFIWKISRKRRLRGADLASVRRSWAHAESVGLSAMQILEADKVLDLALTKLGYQGSLGDKLKKAGPRFSDINTIWNAHKLRNRIAHETNVQVADRDRLMAMQAFRKALEELGM